MKNILSKTVKAIRGRVMLSLAISSIFLPLSGGAQTQLLSVSVNPSGVETVNITSTNVALSNIVSLVVTTNNPAYVFSGWQLTPTNGLSLSAGTTNDASVSIRIISTNAPLFAVANFLPRSGTQPLRVTASPAGSGSVTPAATNNVTVNQVVALSAIESNPAYKFSGWQFSPTNGIGLDPSDPFQSTNDAVISVLISSTNAPLFARANFVSRGVSLTIVANPTNGGYASPTLGIHWYALNDNPKITATASNGFDFVQWEDAANTSVNPINILMDSGPKNLIANFIKKWTVSQRHFTGPAAVTTNVITVRDGTYTNLAPATVVTLPSGNQRYRCNGWISGFGSVSPTNDTGPAAVNVDVTVNAVSGLDWIWQRQYKVTTTTNSTGIITIQELSVDNDPDDQWVDSNTTIRVTVSANDITKFEPDYVSINGVRADLSPTYQVDVLITNPVTIVASYRGSSLGDPGFIAYMKQFSLVAGSTEQHTYDDPDKDGLSNEQEYKLSNTNKGYYYNPINSDSDGDGMDDAYETFSVDPTNLTDQARASYHPAATDNGSDLIDHGPGGNPDYDFHWSTTDGYMQPGFPLLNIEEYIGPDTIVPYTSVAVNFGDAGYPFAANPVGFRPTVYVLTAVLGDTKDQSKANTANSDRDIYDDGYEYSWDQWQHWGRTTVTWSGDSTNEVFLYGVSNTVPYYYTNTIPNWATARVFNPNRTDVIGGGGPDKDVLYDYKTGKVSEDYYTAEHEYSAWQVNAFSPIIAAAPHTIRLDNPPPIPANLVAAGVVTKRSSHPFLWDVDQDGLPDGYEVIFGYDPWHSVTPGKTVADGMDNPDNDWMARANPTNAFSLRNHEVYLAYGFNPYTAVDEVYPIVDDMPGKGSAGSPNTAKYSNMDELRGPDGIMALTPGTGGDDATNPFKYDSDGDGIWDGWENYVGLNPNAETDGPGDSDGDTLSNLDEFRSFYTSSTNRSALTPLVEWLNKIFPTDPNDMDTDGDKVPDSGDPSEKKAFNGTSITTTNMVLDADGVMTSKVFTAGTWNGKCYTGGGLNPTSSDTDQDTLPDPYEAAFAGALDGTLGDIFLDPDGDRLKNYQEYFTCAIYHWQYDVWVPNRLSYDSADFFSGIPKPWDWSKQTYIPVVYTGYAGTSPGMSDSDGDNMDDYYEIYHGLNPIYGVFDLVQTRNVGVQVYTGTKVADYRLKPYVAGTPEADPDGDGLPNTEEAPIWYYQQQSPRYHTDPTPLWMTDTGYNKSWVNLYYRPSEASWPWALPPSQPPQYAFDFESNEGFDTDGDSYSDYEELNVTKTDPMSAESPVKRRALYLPVGQDAYARTCAGYVPGVTYPKSGYIPGTHFITYSGDYLRSFTIEAWVRPINPTNGSQQVILERPMMLPNGNPMDLAPGIRLNFRLAVDADGYPYASYNGNGTQLIFPEARVTGSSKLIASNWTHVAATYQVPSFTNALVDGEFCLYINGKLAKKDFFRELPANGVFNPAWQIYGAPIVVGAADANPNGIFAGPGPLSPQPDPGSFFKGWIDEVRVWDGARNAGEILVGMTKRMKQSDVIASRPEVSSLTNGAVASLASSLFYLFSFDALPDPDHSATTSGTGIAFDPTATAIFPAGWTVSWWGDSPEHSQIYSDYRMIPWIQNASAHTPEFPVTDIGSTNTYALLLTGTNAASHFAPFWNSANPYGYRYYTELDNVFSFTDIANDLLPLRWAQADEDVPMWDDGTVPATTPFDTDGDGMSDSWEELYGMDPLVAGDTTTDSDGDGLSNYYEFLTGNDPYDPDSNDNGVIDGEEDFDLDGIENHGEMLIGTDPRLADTDDDGIGDLTEITMGSNPASSTSPQFQRGIVLPGTTNAYVQMPISARFGLLEWTVEAWVCPTAVQAGTVVYREARPGDPNYFIKLNSSMQPVVGLGADTLTANFVLPVAGNVNSSSNWTHLAATYQVQGQRLRLYVNGVEQTNKACAHNPHITGDGVPIQRIGQNFAGVIDEVRIWNVARGSNELQQAKSATLAGNESGLVAYYRFDDGSSYMAGVVGTSRNPGWTYGQVEDFAANFAQDWKRDWKNAASVVGGISWTNLPSNVPVGIELDSDGDGMPDSWENLYLSCGLDPFSAVGVAGPDGDPDGDGISNLEEYFRGTDPCIADILTVTPATINVQVGHSVLVNVLRAAGSNATISVFSSDESLFSVSPSVIMFAAGQTSAVVRVTGVALGEGMGAHDGLITFVSDEGGAQIPVTVFNGVSLMLTAPSGGDVVAGDTVTMSVRRNRSVGSITEPQEVALSSSSPRAAQVPGTVTIHGGADTAWFQLTGVGVESGVVIKAEAPGYAHADMAVDIVPPTLAVKQAGVATTNIVVPPGGSARVQLVRNSDQEAADLTLGLTSLSSAFTLGNANATFVAGDSAVWVELNAASTPGNSYLLITSGVWTQRVAITSGSGGVLSPDDPGADPDGDGLINMWEDVLGTDRHLVDTDSNGISDFDEDTDGDGLSNGDEIFEYHTDPSLWDTDDDGISDGDEVDGSVLKYGKRATVPTYSLSPRVPRSMLITNGVPVVLPEPLEFNADTGVTAQRFAGLNHWAIGCWVKPNGMQANASLISRVLTNGMTNFNLRLVADVPRIEFTTTDGVTHSLVAPLALPTNTWSAVLAVLDKTTRVLTLYVNDIPMASRTMVSHGVSGQGVTLLGAGLNGWLDDVYIGSELWRSGAGVPDYALVLDVSGSMSGQPLADLKSAAKSAIDNMPAGAEMEVISFSDTAIMSAAFTSDHAKLKNAVDGLQIIGGTEYEPALNMLTGSFTNRSMERARVALFISDGGPNQSPAASVIQAVSNANIKIDSIGFGTYSSSAPELQRLADGTGGQYYPAPSAAELDTIMKGLVSFKIADISAYYPFDDGGLLAEDIIHTSQWAYALSGVTFDSSTANTKMCLFNWMAEEDTVSIPAWWAQYFLQSSDTSPNIDTDGDGLVNLDEYILGLDPSKVDTDGNSLRDGEEDFDADGIANADERSLYGTHAWESDTDDDGFSDGLEVNGGIPKAGVGNTSPLYSRSPSVPRSAVLNGQAIDIPEPYIIDIDVGDRAQRFQNLTNWAVACIVKPASSGETGSLLIRTTLMGMTNFDLRLDANVPTVSFMGTDGSKYSVVATQAIEVGAWTTLLAQWIPSNTELRLTVNGIGYVATGVTARCVSGYGYTRLGAGIHGLVDDVYVGEGLKRQETIASTDYALVLDVSGSMYGQPLADLKSAARQAVEMLPDGSEMAIIRFESTATLAQGFTSDKDALNSAIESLAAGGGTEYTDALKMLLQTYQPRDPSRVRTAIFISDGQPNTSPPSSDITALSKANIKVNTIGFNIYPGMETELKRISDTTGGNYFDAPSGGQLKETVMGLVEQTHVKQKYAFYPFDDGGNTAEDYAHLLDWNYSLNVIFSNDAAVIKTPFNWMFTDVARRLPGWWITFFKLPANAQGVNDDPDNDGVSNYNEFLLGTDPMNPNSRHNGISDGNTDADGDGLANADEGQQGTDPMNPDSDDDGLTDKQEVDQGLDPLSSVSPFVMRFIRNDGQGLVSVPKIVGDNDILGTRFNLTNWTVEATVRLSQAPVSNVVLIGRTCEPGLISYELGVASNRVPYIRYQNGAGIEYRIDGPQAIPLNTWVTLGGRYGNDGLNPSRELALFYDGNEVQHAITASFPATGEQRGDLIVARNLIGDISEVRIWKKALRDDFLASMRGKQLLFGRDVVGFGSLAPNGGSLLQFKSDAGLENFTITAWFKTTSAGTIIKRRDNSAGINNYLLKVDADGRPSGSVDFSAYEYLGTNGFTNIVFTVAVKGESGGVMDGQWHSIGFSSDGSSLTLIVDGKYAGLTDLPFAGFNNYYYYNYFGIRAAVGPGRVEIGTGLRGMVDEVAVYSVAQDFAVIRRNNGQKASGNDLVLYYDFDGYEPLDYPVITDKVSGNTAVLYGAAQIDTGNNAPVVLSPFSVLSSKMALYMPMDDGRWIPRNGVQAVEDFSKLGNKEYAGTLLPSTAHIDFVPLVNPYTNTLGASVPKFYPMVSDMPWRMDSDGDGLPDIFEQYFRLSPNDTSDALEDSDGDGLANIYEYYAGTDPWNPDSARTGFADYDSRTNKDMRTWGELYDDGDGIPDLWESLYPGPCPATGRQGLDPKYYDANLDPDGDGWYNFAEYMGTMVTTNGSTFRTDPLNPSSYPTPMVGVHVRYTGRLGASIDTVTNPVIRLNFYTTSAMDGYPDATAVMRAGVANLQIMETGHLREGTNYVFSYLDVDNNGQWTPETEPAGIAQFQPIKLGWDDLNNVEIGLTDSMPGYPRFSWNPAPNVSRYIVTNFVGQALGRVIKGPRNYWHEGDWLNAGYLGINAGPYSLAVYTNEAPLGDYTNFTDFVNGLVLGSSRIVTPNGSTAFQYALNEIAFAVDPNASGYRLQISATSNAASILASSEGILPYTDGNGVQRIKLPFYAGDNYVPVGGNYASAKWTNGLYWARVQGIRAGTNAPYSASSSFVLNVAPPSNAGASSIAGDVFYFGKVSHGFGVGQTSNLTIIVQAFESAGFSGMPDAQVQISYTCNTNAPTPAKGSYIMNGLHSKRFHVRAFIDLNGNRILDSWEPFGFAKSLDLNADYTPLGVDVTSPTAMGISNVRIVIRDRDTDDDQLPDGWEWMYYGSLTKFASDIASNTWTILRNYEIEPADLDPTKDDYDGDGVKDIIEVDWTHARYGAQPDPAHVYNPYDPVANPTGTDLNPIKWDTDGDGLSDGYEITHGLNPLDPTDGAAQIAKASAAGEVIPGIPAVSQIAAAAPDLGQFSLTWQGQIGMAYEVQFSDDLQTWVPAVNGLRYGAVIHTYVDESPAVSTRFYRVVMK